MPEPFFESAQKNDPEWDLKWERTVVLELYKEYNTVTSHHKVPLRPVAIALFDSNLHWGQWDLQTRTILISRKLVQEYSWFQVQSILRHEMAHQWVDEIDKVNVKKPDEKTAETTATKTAAKIERPHGPLFKKACQTLGVPAEFSSATANLQINDPNWKRQQKNNEVEKLLDKAQKLLSLATSSNEHEALLAMNKVRELYAKYNLSQAAIHSELDFAHLIITHQKKRIEAHHRKIVGILVGHFFIKVLYCSTFDSKTGKHFKAIELIGTRANVLMGEYVYYFLLQQIESLVKDLKRGRKDLSRLALKSYRLGVLQGFEDKLAELDRESVKKYKKSPSKNEYPESYESHSLGKALVLLEEDSRLDTYLSEAYPRISTTTTARQWVEPSVYSAGKVAGKKITLHKAVSSRAGNQGFLLSDKR